MEDPGWSSLAVILRAVPSVSFVCRRVYPFEARAARATPWSRLSSNLSRMAHFTATTVRVRASVAGVRDLLPFLKE